MKRKIFAGTTSVELPIMIYDSSSTTGAGLGSLVFNTASLVAEYRRKGSSNWTAISLVTTTLGTYTLGGFIADGSLTGAYALYPPDACFAAGVPWVAIRLRGASNMLPVLIEVELDQVNYQDPAAFGLTRLDAAITSRMATYVQPTGFLAATFSGTVASTTNITSASGVILGPTGLDSIPISAPTGVATTFPAMVVQTWRRFFKKATRSATELKTYADNGTTVVTTQTISDDGAGSEVQGVAS